MYAAASSPASLGAQQCRMYTPDCRPVHAVSPRSEGGKIDYRQDREMWQALQQHQLRDNILASVNSGPSSQDGTGWVSRSIPDHCLMKISFNAHTHAQTFSKRIVETPEDSNTLPILLETMKCVKIWLSF
eukprot:984-Amphidinium_carterae.1